MPMTEAHTYSLSTAENELGVVVAHSQEGQRKLLTKYCIINLLYDGWPLI